MMVIGLTGGIGSGKTTVANLFAQKGVKVIDADKLARDVILPGQLALQKIIEKYGTDILEADGNVNRSRLRGIIFENPNERIWLEKLLHPLIRVQMKQEIELAQSPYCIVVIPLLFETEQNPLIDRILVVDASKEYQIERTRLRDGSSEKEVAAIIDAQISRKERLARADDIIYNNGSVDELIPQVDKLHEIYLRTGMPR